MNATDLAAWWGAGVGTMVLLWDIYKWAKSGPMINVTVAADMQAIGAGPGADPKKKYVAVEVTNTGDRSTTITHLFGYHYKSWLALIFKKKKSGFAVVNPAFSARLPHLLASGERWLSGIEQTPELENMSRKGRLLVGIHHSSNKKPVLRHLVIPERRATLPIT